MTRSFFTTQTGLLCACCLVTFLLGSRTWRIRQASKQSSKSRSLRGSPKPIARWPSLSLEWSRASTSVTASRSRYGPTTNLWDLKRSHQPTTRMRSSGCIPECGHSVSRRRTSRVAPGVVTCPLRGAPPPPAPPVCPEEGSGRDPDVDHELPRECRILMLAMTAPWRWDRDDQLPNGRQLGTEWLSQIRAALDRYGLDAAP